MHIIVPMICVDYDAYDFADYCCLVYYDAYDSACSDAYYYAYYDAYFFSYYLCLL